MHYKFRYLLEKNYKAEIRMKRKFLFELFLLVIFYMIIAINPVSKSTHYELDEVDLHKTKFSRKRDLENLTDFRNIFDAQSGILKYGLFFTPKRKHYIEIVGRSRKKFQLATFRGFGSDYLMETHFEPLTTLAGITFVDLEKMDENDAQKVPRQLYYKLRFPSKFRTLHAKSIQDNLWITRCSGVISSEEVVEDTVDEEDEYGQADIYQREGFLPLQHLIYLLWFDKINQEYYNGSREKRHPPVSVRTFRHWTTKELCNVSGTSNLLFLLYSFTFFLPFLNFVWKFAREREANIFVQHWNYGINYSQHWIAHFIISYLHLILLNLVIMILVMIPWSTNPASGVFIDVNPAGGIIFLLTYDVGLIFTAIFVACCFKNAKNCIYLAIFLWITSYGVFSVLLFYSEGIHSPSVFVSFILFFNNTFGYGMNFLKNIKNAGEYDIYFLLAPMICNILMNFIIVAVLEYRMPGRYMQPNHFDFMGLLGKCHKSKKRKKKKKKIKAVLTIVDAESDESWRNYQSPPHNGEQFIKLKSIGTYGDSKDKARLENITMEFFKGEITVIVGHHGAGKTTLLTIIAMWKSPDYGIIRYFGQDITFRNWHRYRKNVDVVMPINHLFDLLTVKETIEYYVNMKSDYNDELKFNIEISKWLYYLRQLFDTKSGLVTKLSFGEQRILTLCCALICDTKVVLLDNPTGRMAAKEQTLFWKILQAEKLERTIIMTTNSMDEAEIVGDRIAILEHGVLKAYGTLFFMRTNFEIGYDMVIQKKPNFSSGAITNMIERFFPNAKLMTEQPNQIAYKLPAEKRKLYQHLLLHLENNRRTLGIEHIEVVGSELSDVSTKLSSHRSNQMFKNEPLPSKFYFLTGKTYKRQIIKAMFFKKILTQAPSVLPIAMVFISMILIIFIGFLSGGLKRPPIRHQGLSLGFPINQSSHVMLRDVLSEENEDCQFFVIKELDVGSSSLSKTNEKTRLFKNSSFECGRQTFTDYLLKSKTIHDKFGAIEIEEGKYGKEYVVWVNQRILHSAPLALNFLHNYVVHSTFEDIDCKVLVDNDPLPIPLNTKINLLDNLLCHMPMAMIIGTILPLTTSGFVISITEERISDWWHLQKIAGMSYHVYWIVTLFWDSLTFFIYCIIYTILLSFITVRGFGGYEKLVMLLLLFFYIPSSLALTYLVTMWASDSIIRAYLKSAIFHLITGLCVFVLYWDVFENNSFFYAVFMFFPNFALLDGLSNIFSSKTEQNDCQQMCNETPDCDESDMCEYIPQCCHVTFFKFEDPGVLLHIGSFIISCCLLFVIIFLLIVYRREKLYAKPKNLRFLRSATYAYDDRDVVKMRKAIAESDLRECKRKRYWVDQLEGKIPKHNKILHTISFSAEKGQCIVFYGSRQSGKSHLMCQLAGKCGFTFGSIYTHGFEMKYDFKNVCKLIGYCPQTGGLIEVISVKNHLHIMSLIRGVPKQFISHITDTLIDALDLRKDAHRKVCNLPLHKRRKVSIALAFVGQTEIILLDEPTLGIPNYVKQEVWKFLKWQVSLGKTIIMTTTDMLESEVMGNVVFIFHRSEIWAIGTAQNLRTKYTKGFYVEVKINRDGSNDEEIAENFQKDVDNLNRFMSFMHSDSEQIKRNDNVLRYYVPVERVSYSYLYGAMEKNRSRLNVTDYTICQGNMRDVMTTLALTRTHVKY